MYNLLGFKLKMTHVFCGDKKQFTPVTCLQAGPCFVTQKKTIAKDGYNAIQIGFAQLPSVKHINKPELGHLASNSLPPLKFIKEFRTDKEPSQVVGQQLHVNLLSAGDLVNIKSKSTGKGYAGNVKKNHFKRGPESHGSKHHKSQGSLGAGTTPSRVFPGKKMSGRLGGLWSTTKNLRVIEINVESNLVIIKGSIPGKIGALVYISKI